VKKTPIVQRLVLVFTGLLLLLISWESGAVGTRRFELFTSKDFEGGDLEGVAIDSTGKVRAGFSLGSVPVADAVAIWSLLPLRDGSLLLGTGNEGKLLRVKDGKVSVAADTKALVVTSLAEAWGGAVVVGTLPEGKVMKYERDQLSTLVTLKGVEHVWQVAFDKQTNSVFAATGPEGKLWRINANGKAQLYFDADEEHLMSVAVAPDGTVYAGASDKAKLYKLTGPGRASVLYDFARTEVRAIVAGSGGQVYAVANEITSGGGVPKKAPSGQSSAKPVRTSSKTKGKGVLYRFAPDGSPEKLLESTSEHYVSLALGDDGRPYVGTGVDGKVYSVDDVHGSVLVADTEERQVGGLLLSAKERFVACSDPAVLHPVRGVGGVDAVWTSKALDAGLRARFGRLSWVATGKLELSTRTGNTKDPDDTWSDWSQPLVAPGVIQSPPARYLQVRARWSHDPDAVLSEVEIPFVTDNLRAVVTEIEVSSPAKKSASSTVGVQASGGPIDAKPDATVKLSWKVDNEDKDELRYRLEYRLVGTTVWYDLLKPKEVLKSTSYSWDTADLPEGRYRVRVTATDELSNPPGRTTRHQLESDVIFVDNTPPVFKGLKLVGRRIQGTVIDGVGPIERIEVSVVGSGEWYPFYPRDGIFDERQEDFDADVSSLVSGGPALLAIRAYDRANNFVLGSLALR
jgi:hypothetical protein